MYNLSNDGFSFHTFQLTKRITFEMLRDIIRNEYKESKINRYKFYKDEKSNVWISNRFASKGVKLKLYENPMGKPPHIEAVINPRIAMNDYNYIGIFVHTPKNMEIMIENINSMLALIDKTLTFESMTLSRIDLCANIEFDTKYELEEYMRLVRKCRIPNGYSREKFKSNQIDYKLKNKSSFRASRNIDMLTIYNKTIQLEYKKNIFTEKNILRFELCLYRRSIYDIGTKKFKNLLETNFDLVNYLAFNSKKYIMLRLDDFFQNGIYFRYDMAERIVKNYDAVSSKMRQRMLYLLKKTSDLSNLNKSLRNLKEEYSLNDRQVEGVLSAFETLGINPVTLSNKSIDLARPNVKELFMYDGNKFIYNCQRLFKSIGVSVGK